MPPHMLKFLPFWPNAVREYAELVVANSLEFFPERSQNLVAHVSQHLNFTFQTYPQTKGTTRYHEDVGDKSRA